MTVRAIAILLLAPMTASAQDVTEPALKAAFIYHFAKSKPVDLLSHVGRVFIR